MSTQRGTKQGKWNFQRDRTPKKAKPRGGAKPTCGNCRWLKRGKCADRISRTTSRGFMRGIECRPEHPGCEWWKERI